MKRSRIVPSPALPECRVLRRRRRLSRLRHGALFRADASPRRRRMNSDCRRAFSSSPRRCSSSITARAACASSPMRYVAKATPTPPTTQAARRIADARGKLEPAHAAPADLRRPPSRRRSRRAANTTREEYMQMVRDGMEYIRAGDIFQFVPSQRFETEYTRRPAHALSHAASS